MLTLGTRVRWCEALYYTYKIASGFQITRFSETISCCTLENWKKKSITLYVYSIPHSNCISFGRIDKWRNYMYFGLHSTLHNLLFPSKHIYYLPSQMKSNQFYEKVNYCAGFDTIVYSLQDGCHLFYNAWKCWT